MSSGSNLLVLGGVALGGYWLYENFFATAATAAAGTTSTGTAASTGTAGSPCPAGEILGSTGACEPISGTTLESGTGTSGAVKAAGPTTYPTPGGGTAPIPVTLAGIWAAIQQWADQDTKFSQQPATFSNVGGVNVMTAPAGLVGDLGDWNFYLAYVVPTAPSGYNGSSWPPDTNEVFPGTSFTTPMVDSQYWTTMSAYLAGKGMSGVFGLSGLLQGLYGMGDDASLPPCNTISVPAGTVGPFNCDATTGPVNYTVSASELANLAATLQSEITGATTSASATNYTPYVLGGIALLAIVMVAASSGGRRR